MKSQEQQSGAGSTSSTEGFSWQFRLMMGVIAISVLGLIGKALGLF